MNGVRKEQGTAVKRLKPSSRAASTNSCAWINGLLWYCLAYFSEITGPFDIIQGIDIQPVAIDVMHVYWFALIDQVIQQIRNGQVMEITSLLQGMQRVFNPGTSLISDIDHANPAT